MSSAEVIGDGYRLTRGPGDGAVWTLEQDLIVEPHEDPIEVARSLIGDKTTAQFVRIVMHPGAQWPTAIYVGTRNSLGTIIGKAKGSKIGYPKGRPRNERQEP